MFRCETRKADVDVGRPRFTVNVYSVESSVVKPIQGGTILSLQFLHGMVESFKVCFFDIATPPLCCGFEKSNIPEKVQEHVAHTPQFFVELGKEIGCKFDKHLFFSIPVQALDYLIQ